MITKQMKELYEQNKVRDNYNPAVVQEMWDKQIKVLCANLDDTIAYLKIATQEEIHYLTEVFEDVSEYWQSEELVQAMEDAVNRCDEHERKLSQVDLYYARKVLKK